MRIGSSPFQNAMPGGNGFNGVPGHSMHNTFNPPIGGPPPVVSNSLTRPHVADLSPAEIYCQQHEVTATVCSFSFEIIFHYQYLIYLDKKS